VLSRNYLVQQVIGLLSLAKKTSDPDVTAALLKKATDLNDKLNSAPPKPDMSPRPPDVER